MMKNFCISTAYLPPISYFYGWDKVNTVMVEQYEHYIKQTYRNRCVIASPNGPLALTIPVVKPDSPKTPIKEIRISDHGNWRHLHWNALVSAYNNTPFFEYYKDDFQPFYEKKFDFLLDYNTSLIKIICDLVDLHPTIERTDYFLDTMPEGMIDKRNLPFVRNNDEKLEDRPYYQVFQEKLGFLPHLSIVDLLFNLGPEALIYLSKMHDEEKR